VTREALENGGPPIASEYDVVIAGGGLAGSCLALQLARSARDVRVLVVERSAYPLPEAAHKVGESSVEIASTYFRKTLGLQHVLADELPKFGLRFFASDGGNEKLEQRLECGPSHYLYVPSYQIDRGQFENALASEAREQGVDFKGGHRVSGVELGEDGGDHRVTVNGSSSETIVSCRWFVDASGRTGLLKKKLGLAKSNRHAANAAWFRLDAPIDLDDWSDDEEWKARVHESRRLSTNHLMGAGYWVWIIPLAHGRTSVGIVADDRLHPFAELSSLDKALDWLDRHEPQCARIVRANADRQMDFRAIRNYSYDVKQVFSADRWCVVGEAGMFVDPLYSPGSDFIAIGNGFVSDLVVRQLRGESIDEIAGVYDQVYRSFGRTFLVTYHRQYPLLGTARVMATKIVWDFVMYWGSFALLFARDQMCDAHVMSAARPTLHEFAALNVRMQAFFRSWDEAQQAAPPRSGTFVDYAELGFLAELNRALESASSDVVEQLEQNLGLARDLRSEIVSFAGRLEPKLPSPTEAPLTAHLREMFESLEPAR
jgi:flavin-dependent dehydrogenase